MLLWLWCLLGPAWGGELGDVEVGGFVGFLASGSFEQGSKAGFNASPWYLNLSGNPVGEWYWLGEVEAESAFKFEGEDGGEVEGVGELKLERLYVEYRVSDALRIRGGKFFLPWGYWYNLHWQFLTETVSRPFSFSNQFTPRFQVGLQAYGGGYVGDSNLRYSAWLGDGPDQYGTNRRSTAAMGVGGNVSWEHRFGGDPKTSVGAVAGIHHQRVASGQRQDNVVLGAKARFKLLDLRAEHYEHARAPGRLLHSSYLAASVWLVNPFALTYRFDSGDDGKGTGTIVKATAHSAGFEWRPEPSVLIKGELRAYDPRPGIYENTLGWNLFTALRF